MSTPDQPLRYMDRRGALQALSRATVDLTLASKQFQEYEGERGPLLGPLADLISGLSQATSALAALVEDELPNSQRVAT